MYINRPEHEDALRRAIKTKYNVVVFGDSGCGKSWLYKKVFKDDNVFYDVVDFSGAVTADDVDLKLLEAISDFQDWAEFERTETGDASLGALKTKLGYKDATKWRKIDSSPFLQLLAHIRAAAGRRKSFLVLENLEYVLDQPEVVKRIQLMLLALDDPTAGELGVQLCLVGVPSEIKQILSDGNKFQTISNRVYEVPELNRMEKKEVELLARRGLEQQLDFTIESPTFCYSKIAFVTYQIPQYVHDVCLHVALRAEDAYNIVNPDVIEDALGDWLKANARQSTEFIRNWVMNDRSKHRTKAKIIYCISRLEKHFFTSEDIVEWLDKIFPKMMAERRPQVLRALRSLTEGEQRLLKCDAERRLFRVATPQIRSSLWIGLRLRGEEVSIKTGE
nr:AAA family ATPase [uncultured Celeribacter sp.]